MSAWMYSDVCKGIIYLMLIHHCKNGYPAMPSYMLTVAYPASCYKGAEKDSSGCAGRWKHKMFYTIMVCAAEITHSVPL